MDKIEYYWAEGKTPNNSTESILFFHYKAGEQGGCVLVWNRYNQKQNLEISEDGTKYFADTKAGIEQIAKDLFAKKIDAIYMHQLLDRLSVSIDASVSAAKHTMDLRLAGFRAFLFDQGVKAKHQHRFAMFCIKHPYAVYRPDLINKIEHFEVYEVK